MDMFIYNFTIIITIVLYVSDEGDVGKNGFKSNLAAQASESCRAVTV